MLPDHCRHVSLRKVDFNLIQGKIEEKLLGTKIYKGTEFLILNNGGKYCITRIGKTPRRGLFWEITSIELLSDADKTVYHIDPEADVLNKNSMGSYLKKYPGKTIVVKGKFEHISFITPEPMIELTVLEVIPPRPPKIAVMAKDLLKFRSFSKPILINEIIIDINSLIEAGDNRTILLPCHASEVDDDPRIKYLDEFPVITADDKNNITLAGCELSLRIFKEIYGFEPRFINICPANHAAEIPKDGPVLIKCCNVKSFERKNTLFIVPWGATYTDLEEAMIELINIYGS